MDLLATENQPETCAVLGLDCGNCMRQSASCVARICGNLEADGIKRIFFELYPSPGCRPMSQAFESAYRECTMIVEPTLATAAAA